MIMRRILLLLFLLFTAQIIALTQSNSMEKFRKAYPEDQNVFFYSSTLKMLDTDNNPEFGDLIKDIDKIMVLIYEKEKQKFTKDDIIKLKKNLKKEKYVDLMLINQNGNNINLYSRDRKGKTIGFAALINNKESMVLIDVKGSIDFSKFMDLKNKIDLKL